MNRSMNAKLGNAKLSPDHAAAAPTTPGTASNDHLVLLQIDGMHCHRCEQAIQRALGAFRGVREVEVDFPSGQASILHERGSVTAGQLMKAIDDAGYRATGFIERDFNTI